MKFDLLAHLGVGAGCPAEGVLLAFCEAAKSAHPDGGFQTGSAAAWLDLTWAYQAALDRDIYSVNPDAWMQANPRPDRVTDWRAWMIEEVTAHLERVLKGVAEGADSHGRFALPEDAAVERMDLVEPWGKFLPSTWDLERIGWLGGAPPPMLDVEGDLAALLRLPEFDLAKGATFQVVYRVKAQKRTGQTILASIRPIPASEREMWPRHPAPMYRLQIWWPWWAAMAGWTGPRGFCEARYHLLHHELGHCLVVEKDDVLLPRARGHELEEFGASMERYGARNRSTAVLLARGYHHPNTQRLLAEVPDVMRTWLRQRIVDDDAPSPTRMMPSPAAYRAELHQLRQVVDAGKARQLAVDFGAAPWDEAATMLELLETRTAIQTDQEMDQLRRLRELIRRWAPGALADD